MIDQASRHGRGPRTPRPCRSPSFTSLLLAALFWVAPAPAAGDAPPEAPADEEARRAEQTELLKTYTERAVAAVQGGRLSAASDAFATAYALESAPVLLFNLAQAQRKEGRDGPAVAFFERFLEEAPPGPLRAEAERLQAEARQRIRRSGGARVEEATDRTILLRDHVERGARAAEAGQYDAASWSFTAAYALSPAPTLLFNLAQVHRKAGRARLALALFGRFLRDAQKSPLRTEAEARMAEVRAQIEAIYRGAEAAQRGGRDAEALAGYERYLQEAPRGPWSAQADAQARALRQRIAAAEARGRRGAGPGRRAAMWSLGAVGLAAVVIGAVLVGVDGQQSCAKAAAGHCELELEGRIPGGVLLGTGLAALGASALLFGLDYRRDHGGARVAMATVSGRF